MHGNDRLKELYLRTRKKVAQIISHPLHPLRLLYDLCGKIATENGAIRREHGGLCAGYARSGLLYFVFCYRYLAPPRGRKNGANVYSAALVV